MRQLTELMEQRLREEEDKELQLASGEEAKKLQRGAGNAALYRLFQGLFNGLSMAFLSFLMVFQGL